MSDRFGLAPWQMELLTVREWRLIVKFLEDEDKEIRRQQRG